MHEHNNYILVGREVRVEPDLLKWAEWFEGPDDPAADRMAHRRVQKTTLATHTVFTTFLGNDHNWGNGPPLVFETMMHRPDPDEWEDPQWRYSTFAQAEMGHWLVVACAIREDFSQDIGVPIDEPDLYMAPDAFSIYEKATESPEDDAGFLVLADTGSGRTTRDSWRTKSRHGSKPGTSGRENWIPGNSSSPGRTRAHRELGSLWGTTGRLEFRGIVCVPIYD